MTGTDAAPGAPIGEDDLQAYIDDRLPTDRRALVEAVLAEQPDLRARVERERRQRDALARALHGKMREPIPARLRPANIRAARRARMAGRLRTAAAAVLLLAIGGVGGWGLGRQSVPAPMPGGVVTASAVSRDALAAYRTYVVEVAHPVEVGADNEKHLMAWLSKRLGRPLAAPDLTRFGYALMGGRLLPAGAGAAAQLMYQTTGGERLTLYVQASGGEETAFRFFQDRGASTLAWLDRGFGFAVTAPIGRDALLPIAEAVYHGFEEGHGFDADAPKPG